MDSRRVHNLLLPAISSLGRFRPTQIRTSVPISTQNGSFMDCTECLKAYHTPEAEFRSLGDMVNCSRPFLRSRLLSVTNHADLIRSGAVLPCFEWLRLVANLVMRLSRLSQRLFHYSAVFASLNFRPCPFSPIQERLDRI